MAASEKQALRALPSVDELLSRLDALPYPRALVVNEIRRVLDQARSQIRSGATDPAEEQVPLEAQVTESLARLVHPSLRRVINATGGYCCTPIWAERRSAPWSRSAAIRLFIPDSRRHCQRFYGAYSNRGRIRAAARDDETAGLPAALRQRDPSEGSREARSTWARLVRKIFEADPLLCSCGGRMRIVSFITDPRLIDRILRHRKRGHCKTSDPFETRAPPHRASAMVQ
jgi:hypothetical protein